MAATLSPLALGHPLMAAQIAIRAYAAEAARDKLMGHGRAPAWRRAPGPASPVKQMIGGAADDGAQVRQRILTWRQRLSRLVLQGLQRRVPGVHVGRIADNEVEAAGRRGPKTSYWIQKSGWSGPGRGRCPRRRPMRRRTHRWPASPTPAVPPPAPGRSRRSRCPGPHPRGRRRAQRAARARPAVRSPVAAPAPSRVTRNSSVQNSRVPVI